MDNQKWICAHAAAQYESVPQLRPGVGDRTIRADIMLGKSGSALRLVLGDLYGDKEAIYGKASVEVGGKSYILTGNHEERIIVRPHSLWQSDPVPCEVRSGDVMTLSLYLESENGPVGESIVPAWHSAKGEFTEEEFVPEKCGMFTDDERLRGYVRTEVLSDEGTEIAAVLGDSITAMELWTKHVQKAWAASGDRYELLNMGISGNRLLRDTSLPQVQGIQVFGQSGLKRLTGDILSLPGIKTAVVALGVNDISQPGGEEGMSPPIEELVSVQELKDGFLSVIRACHERGIETVGCTITPFGGFGTYSPEREDIRLEINEWILHSGSFDRSIDFASAVSDPQNPARMAVRFDSGDHLHPGEEGGRAMAELFLKCMEK